MKRFFYAIIAMICLVSCGSDEATVIPPKQFTINVNLKNATDKTVYLQRYDNGEMAVLDSVVIKDSLATFKVLVNDNLDAYNVVVKGWRRPLVVFADNQDVTITGDYQDVYGINVLASKNQEKVEQTLDVLSKIEDEQEIHFTVLDSVKQNIDHPIAPYILYNYKWAFELYDLEQLMSVFPQDMKSGYKDLIMKYIDGLKLTEVGMPYINFTSKDVNREDFELSSVIGKSKVVILDFWASWCPDCRKENPGLVKIYKEFHKKGLDIVSVSFDRNEEAWKKAIADDKLTWKNHVSDLNSLDNEAARLYTIAFIPQNLIIDENGIIIKKNLPADRMREFLVSILK